MYNNESSETIEISSCILIESAKLKSMNQIFDSFFFNIVNSIGSNQYVQLYSYLPNSDMIRILKELKRTYNHYSVYHYTLHNSKTSNALYDFTDIGFCNLYQIEREYNKQNYTGTIKFTLSCPNKVFKYSSFREIIDYINKYIIKSIKKHKIHIQIFKYYNDNQTKTITITNNFNNIDKYINMILFENNTVDRKNLLLLILTISINDYKLTFNFDITENIFTYSYTKTTILNNIDIKEIHKLYEIFFYNDILKINKQNIIFTITNDALLMSLNNKIREDSKIDKFVVNKVSSNLSNLEYYINNITPATYFNINLYHYSDIFLTFL